ncbi:hypothetical protein UlMin_036414, partial [Ulmus minor]
EKEKGKTEGDSSFVDVVETDSEIDPKVEKLKKKVTFSPENETFVFVGTDTGSDTDQDSKSKKKRKQVAKGKKVQGNPVRATRSRGQRLDQGDLEVVSLPLGKRTRGRKAKESASVSVAEMGDKDPPENSKGELFSRQLRSRKVDSEAGSKAGDEDLPVSQKKRTLKGLNISTNVQLEDPPRRTRRNTGFCFASTANGQSTTHEDEVKMKPSREAPVEKGANAAKRRQSVRFASVEQSTTHEDEVKMVPSREAPLEKGANAPKRRQSVRFASVEQSTTHEEEVEMMPSREAPLEKGAKATKRRQSVRFASVEQSTTLEDEVEMKPSRAAPLEKGANVAKRRQSIRFASNEQSTIHEDERRVKPSGEAPSEKGVNVTKRRQSIWVKISGETSVKRGEVAVTKNDRRMKKRRETILTEEIPEIVYEPVQEKPKRQSTRNAAKSKVKLTELSGNAAKKTKRGRLSKVVEEDSFAESTLLPEEAPGSKTVLDLGSPEVIERSGEGRNDFSKMNAETSKPGSVHASAASKEVVDITLNLDVEVSASAKNPCIFTFEQAHDSGAVVNEKDYYIEEEGKSIEGDANEYSFSLSNARAKSGDNNVVELESPEQVECPNKLNIPGSSSKCQADSAGKPSHLVDFSEGFEREESQKGQSMTQVGSNVGGELAEHDKVLEDQSLVELNANGKSNPVIEDPILQDKLSEFSESQEMDINSKNPAKEAEQICSYVPNDMEREISQVDETGPIVTERVEETHLPSKTSAFPSELSPEIRDGSQLEAQIISHSTVDGSSDISEVRREMDSNFEMEIPDSSAFSGQIYFFEGQVGDYERTGEGRTTEENKSEDALNSLPASDIQEIIHEGSVGNLVLDGSVLGILDKTDGQVGEKEQQEVSEGGYNKFPPEPIENYSHESSPVTQDERSTNGDGYDPTTVVSKYDKARESSVRMNLDDELESDAVKREEEAMLLPNFTLENEQQGKEYKSQGTSNEICLEVYGHMEGSDESVQTVTQFQQVKSGEHDTQEDVAVDLIESASFVADDLMSRDAKTNTEDNVEKMDIGLNSMDESLKTEKEDDFVVNSEDTSGDNLVGKESLDVNVSDHDVTLNYAHEDISVPLEKGENTDHGDVGNSMKRDEKYSAEVISLVDIFYEKSEACLSPVIGSAQNVCSFPGDNVNSEGKSSAHKNDEDPSDSTNGSNQASDAITQEFGEVLFDDHKGEGALVDAAFVDRADSMISSQIEKSSSSHVPEDKPVARDDIKEVGMSENFSLLSSLGSEMDVHRAVSPVSASCLSPLLGSAHNVCSPGDNVTTKSKSSAHENIDDSLGSEMDVHLVVSSPLTASCLSPVLGLANNVCSPVDNATTKSKSSARENNDDFSDATYGSDQESEDATTQEFVEVLFDDYKGSVEDAAFIDRANFVTSNRIEKASGSYAPDEKPIARDDTEEVGMAENTSLLSSLDSETDVHRVVSSPVSASAGSGCMNMRSSNGEVEDGGVDNTTHAMTCEGTQTQADNGGKVEDEDEELCGFLEANLQSENTETYMEVEENLIMIGQFDRDFEMQHGEHQNRTDPAVSEDGKNSFKQDSVSVKKKAIHEDEGSKVAGEQRCDIAVVMEEAIREEEVSEVAAEQCCDVAEVAVLEEAIREEVSKVCAEQFCDVAEVAVLEEAIHEDEVSKVAAEQCCDLAEVAALEDAIREDEGSKVAAEQSCDTAEVVVMEESIHEDEVSKVAAEQCCDVAEVSVMEAIREDEASKVAAEQCCDVAEVAVLEEAIHEDEVSKVAAEQCVDIAEVAVLEEAIHEDEVSKVAAEQFNDVAEVAVLEEAIHEDEGSKVAAEQICDIAEAVMDEAIHEDEVSKVAAEQCCDVAEVAILEEAIHEDKVSKVAAEQCCDVAEVAILEEAIHEDKVSKVAAEQCCDVAEVAILEEAIHEDEVSKVAAEQCDDLAEVAVLEEAIHEDEVSKVAAEQCNDVAEVAVLEEAIHEDEGSKVAAEQICDIAEVFMEEAIHEDEVSKVAVLEEAIHEDEGSKVAAQQRCDIAEVVLEKPIHEDEGSKVAAEQCCEVAEVSALEEPIIHEDEGSIEEGNLSVINQGCVYLEHHKYELVEMENSSEATEITDSNSAALCGGDDSKPEKCYGETMEWCEYVSELNATVVNAASDEPFSSSGVKEEINKASFTIQEFDNDGEKDSALELKNFSETIEINGGNSASSGEPSAECGANDLKSEQGEDIVETKDQSMDPSEPSTPFMNKFPALGN